MLLKYTYYEESEQRQIVLSEGEDHNQTVSFEKATIATDSLTSTIVFVKEEDAPDISFSFIGRNGIEFYQVH